VIKFKTSTSAPPSFIPPGLIEALEWTTGVTINGSTIDRGSENSILLYRGSPNKKSPVWEERSVPQSDSLEKECLWFEQPDHSMFLEKYEETYLPVFYGTSLWSNRLRNIQMIWGPDGPKKVLRPYSTVCAGEVHFLQEAGYKLRAIASPYRIHQLALSPLGSSLFKILKTLPWDCTYDQMKAVPFVQKALKAKKEVYSVDLSSATDYFPLSLQLAVLRKIFGPVQDIDLFEELSQSYFKSSLGNIVWKRGQPLGLYPSFPSFGLTHGLLLLTLCKGIFRNQFFVVGDDVVILDKQLFIAYTKVMELLECPWSQDKTLVSSTIAEFASKVISQDRVFDQFKWRKISDKNFVDVTRNLGARSYSLLTKRQKKVFDIIKHLLPPVGLNISKPGRDLSQAVYETDMFLRQLVEKRVGSLVSLNGIINQKIYGSMKQLAPFLELDELELITSAFAKKVRCVFKDTVFSHLVDHSIDHAKGFSDILEGLFPFRVLPTPLYSPNYSTQLEEYERLLNLV
jgi:hypothetical protein